jgi:hypothetical protein
MDIDGGGGKPAIITEGADANSETVIVEVMFTLERG